MTGSARRRAPGDVFGPERYDAAQAELLESVDRAETRKVGRIGVAEHVIYGGDPGTDQLGAPE